MVRWCCLPCFGTAPDVTASEPLNQAPPDADAQPYREFSAVMLSASKTHGLTPARQAEDENAAPQFVSPPSVQQMQHVPAFISPGSSSAASSTPGFQSPASQSL